MKRKLWILLIVLAGLLVLNGIGSWAARQGTFLDGRFLTRHVFVIDPENVSRIVFQEGDTLEENPATESSELESRYAGMRVSSWQCPAETLNT